jgi:hypothetical protein
LRPWPPASGRKEFARIAEKLRAARRKKKKAIPLSENEVHTLVDRRLEEHHTEHRPR